MTNSRPASPEDPAEGLNHAGMLNEKLPKKIERLLTDCLTVKAFEYSDEFEVREQCLTLWNKELTDYRNFPSCIQYIPKPDGTFEKVDLQNIADNSVRAFGRDYQKLSLEEKKRIQN